MNLTLGIDPGKTGALAFLDDDGNLAHLEDMPDLTGAALGAWVRALLDDLSPDTVTAAWVEKVGPMPRQGVRSVWTFGEGYGALLGALGAFGIPVHHVTPATWKKHFGLSKDKDLSRQRAVELWPADASRWARKKDDGRAEACLIARYGMEVGG